MKIAATILVMFLWLAIGNLHAQNTTTVEALSEDISNNLDLELVATLFGEAKTLEDFEKSLNDPGTRISNLDLNEDDEVDYLRVIAKSENNAHLITIQAVLGFDQYQDVATIDVVKNSIGEAQVQVVGDEYLYGANHNFDVFFQYPPGIIDFLWSTIFRSWHSPYSYDYYPSYYQTCSPFPTYVYIQNINIYINNYNVYQYTTVRNSETCKEMQYLSRRNDYEIKYPDRSFALRNENTKKKADLNRQKTWAKIEKPKETNTKIATGKKVQKEWKTASELAGRKSKVNDKKVSVSTGKTMIKPTAKTSYNTITSNRSANQSVKKSTSNKSSVYKSKSSTPQSINKKPKKSDFGKAVLNSMVKSVAKTTASNTRASKSTSNNRTSKTYKSNTNTRPAVTNRTSYKPRPASSKSSKTYKSSSKSSGNSIKKSTNKN